MGDSGSQINPSSLEDLFVKEPDVISSQEMKHETFPVQSHSHVPKHYEENTLPQGLGISRPLPSHSGDRKQGNNNRNHCIHLDINSRCEHSSNNNTKVIHELENRHDLDDLFETPPTILSGQDILDPLCSQLSNISAIGSPDKHEKCFRNADKKFRNSDSQVKSAKEGVLSNSLSLTGLELSSGRTLDLDDLFETEPPVLSDQKKQCADTTDITYNVQQLPRLGDGLADSIHSFENVQEKEITAKKSTVRLNHSINTGSVMCMDIDTSNKRPKSYSNVKTDTSTDIGGSSNITKGEELDDLFEIPPPTISSQEGDSVVTHCVMANQQTVKPICGMITTSFGPQSSKEVLIIGNTKISNLREGHKNKKCILSGNNVNPMPKAKHNNHAKTKPFQRCYRYFDFDHMSSDTEGTKQDISYTSRNVQNLKNVAKKIRKNKNRKANRKKKKLQKSFADEKEDPSLALPPMQCKKPHKWPTSRQKKIEWDPSLRTTSDSLYQTSNCETAVSFSKEPEGNLVTGREIELQLRDEQAMADTKTLTSKLESPATSSCIDMSRKENVKNNVKLRMADSPKISKTASANTSTSIKEYDLLGKLIDQCSNKVKTVIASGVMNTQQKQVSNSIIKPELKVLLNVATAKSSPVSKTAQFQRQNAAANVKLQSINVQPGSTDIILTDGTPSKDVGSKHKNKTSKKNLNEQKTGHPQGSDVASYSLKKDPSAMTGNFDVQEGLSCPNSAEALKEEKSKHTVSCVISEPHNSVSPAVQDQPDVLLKNLQGVSPQKKETTVDSITELSLSEQSRKQKLNTCSQASTDEENTDHQTDFDSDLHIVTTDCVSLSDSESFQPVVKKKRKIVIHDSDEDDSDACSSSLKLTKCVQLSDSKIGFEKSKQSCMKASKPQDGVMDPERHKSPSGEDTNVKDKCTKEDNDFFDIKTDRINEVKLDDCHSVGVSQEESEPEEGEILSDSEDTTQLESESNTTGQAKKEEDLIQEEGVKQEDNINHKPKRQPDSKFERNPKRQKIGNGASLLAMVDDEPVDLTVKVSEEVKDTRPGSWRSQFRKKSTNMLSMGTLDRGYLKYYQSRIIKLEMSLKSFEVILREAADTDFRIRFDTNCKIIRKSSSKKRGGKKKKKRPKNKKYNEYYKKRDLAMWRRAEERRIAEEEMRKACAQKPCPYLKRGRCTYGDDCKYSHDKDKTKKKEMCKYYLLNTCVMGDDCLFMHSEFPCKFYVTGGTCYAGDNCKFSHASVTKESQQLVLQLCEEQAKRHPEGKPEEHWQDTSTSEIKFTDDPYSENQQDTAKSGFMLLEGLYSEKS